MSYGYGYDDGGYRAAEPYQGPNLRLVGALIIAASGASAVSCSLKARPRTTGMDIARK